MRSAPIDDFVLDYTVHGPEDARSVVLLHGWPGSSRDYRDVIPLLDGYRVVVPDLRGFGASDKHSRDPAAHYDAAAQARSIAGLVDELGLDRPVLAGYDVGSRVAQALSVTRPDLVGALALSPPLPGVGSRVLDPDRIPEFWYQSFHNLPLSVELIDGDRDQVRRYLRHFWIHWSGPSFELDESEFETLVDDYARPGAFAASINWYRAGAGTLGAARTEQPPDVRNGTPTIVLWQEHDPLFPRAWSDRLGEWFSDVEVRHADGAGHFTPLEAPDQFAAMVRDSATRASR